LLAKRGEDGIVYKTYKQVAFLLNICKLEVERVVVAYNNMFIVLRIEL